MHLAPHGTRIAITYTLKPCKRRRDPSTIVVSGFQPFRITCDYLVGCSISRAVRMGALDLR
jgi:hypothetical protein